MRRNVAFVRRQRTWFRAESDIRWLDATASDVDATALGVARRLVDDSQSAAMPR
jgi:tRNA A37 N6-isopentenylltransferase MiaA